MVISLEIRALAALYPPPSNKKCTLQGCNLELRSQCSPGAVCSYLRHLRPFLLYQSKKYIWGRANAARGLISRDIAKNMLPAQEILNMYCTMYIPLFKLECNFFGQNRQNNLLSLFGFQRGKGVKITPTCQIF